MARIRTIKPEFCTSAQVVECSRNARLLFVLMWMFCDDNGIHPANAKQLRMECFPGDDDVTAPVVQGLVDELKAQGLLTEFENNGQRYLSVTGWKHQRIDKPQPGKYPTPSHPDSRICSGLLPEHSENVPGTLPPEGKGREGKGKEGIGGEGSGEQLRAEPLRDSPPPAAESPPSPPPAICIPLVGDDTGYAVAETDLAEWVTAYPGIDVMQTLRNIRQWNLANPKRRKTARGVRSHIVGWLAREQDRGGRGNGPPARSSVLEHNIATAKEWLERGAA